VTEGVAMGYECEVAVRIKSKEKLMNSLLDEFFSQSEHSRDTLDKKEDTKVSGFYLTSNVDDIKWYDDPLVDLMEDLVRWCIKNRNSSGSFSIFGGGDEEFRDNTNVMTSWGSERDKRSYNGLQK
jgi:hypothetical protein